jgi:hypothetical protein
VFRVAQLAPDGKIYMSSSSNAHYFHVINNPNIRGVGCNVREWGQRLITQNGWSIPNYPVYRLGSLEGSSCDTIYNSVSDVDVGGVRIYPNPASNLCTIELPSAINHATIEILDIIGHRLFNVEINTNSYSLDVSKFPKGMYLVVCKSQNGMQWVRKLILLGVD